MADRWETAVRSMTSCTLPEARKAKPVPRHAMTSLWSPKIERACPAIALAVTSNTPGRSSPEILYMFGIMRSSPWDAVKVVESDPAEREP